MSRCGRCKGRGYVKPTRGFGDQDCPDCKGTGEKLQRSSLGKRTVSLGTPSDPCAWCGGKAHVYHHAVPQQRLDNADWLTPEQRQEAKADIRCGVPGCHRCHDLLEKGHPDYRVEPHMLHPGFWPYVVAFELWPALPAHLQTDESWARMEAVV